MARKYSKKQQEPEVKEFEETIVCINRSSKTVKGGRNFSFGAMVVVGDGKGRVGYGYGKANEVADAIHKGSEVAKKNIINVPMNGSTIPHRAESKFGGAQVMLRPASEGTGLIAGGAMRAVLNLAGVHDILAKSLGSNNQVNVVKATFKAIETLCSHEDALAKRGIEKL